MEKSLKTGTTTIGLIAKDAVVMAAERKSVLGYMVESKVAKKIHKLDEHVGLTIAGMVGDALALVRLLKAQFKLYKLDRGPITIRAAATLLSNILQSTKYFPYLTMLILAGYDSKPGLYSFDPFGGFSEKDKYYSTGSGSPFAYGVLEAEFKENLSVEEAIPLVIKAVKVAIERDIGSGGKGFEVAVVDKNGYRKLSQQEIKKFS